MATRSSTIANKERLDAIRRDWCERYPNQETRYGVEVEVDGRMVVDIPTFYLALGEAVNGTGGYYGAGLDSLDDCLRGGFGGCLPAAITIRHADVARAAMDADADEHWYAANWGSLKPSELEELGLPSDEDVTFANYFDRVAALIRERTRLLLI